MKKIIILSIMCMCNMAMSQLKKELENQVNLVFGLSQVALGGFNIEGSLMLDHLTFDYSHGISLAFSNDALENGEDKDQGLFVEIPWTTGFGVGYRLNNWLNIRVEPKWHRFDIFYENDVRVSENRITNYTTFTLGFGIYGNIKPFKKQSNFLKGIMVVPNLRWWPRVYSSLERNQITYINRNTNTQVVHDARQIGIANSPFIANVSIGYSFSF